MKIQNGPTLLDNNQSIFIRDINIVASVEESSIAKCNHNPVILCKDMIFCRG